MVALEPDPTNPVTSTSANRISVINSEQRHNRAPPGIRAGLQPCPSRATVHRVLVRNGLVDPQAQQHKRKYKRWQRDAPMELWQLDIVDGMRLANGRTCKIVTGVDDHSRYAVIAAVVARPTGKAMCAGSPRRWRASGCRRRC
jgi:hypothetical protein